MTMYAFEKYFIALVGPFPAIDIWKRLKHFDVVRIRRDDKLHDIDLELLLSMYY